MRSLRRSGQTTRQKHNDGSPEECIVWGSLALVLRVSRCAGVAPLRLSAAGAGWRATASPPLFLLQSCVMTVLKREAAAAALLYLSYGKGIKWKILPDGITIAAMIRDSLATPPNKVHAINAVVVFLDFAMVMAIADLAAFTGKARMERLIRVMNNLQQINRDLNNKPTKKSERTGMFMIVGLLTWTATVSISEIILYMKSYIYTGKDWSVMLMYAPFYLAIAQGLLVLMQWGVIVLLVYDAASVLNQHLMRLLHENLVSKAEESGMLGGFVTPTKLVDSFTERLNEATNPDDVLTTYPSQMQGMIRRLAMSHEQIGEVIHQMTVGNGAILIIMLLCKFLHLTESPYYFLQRLNNGRPLLGAVFLLVFWSGIHISTLLLAIETCHWAQGQRETTKFLLSKLMVHLGPRCKPLSQELEQFVKQTLLTDPKFMPLGVYTLARPLMATILGGVTTYLVIIIQFRFGSVG